MGEDDGKKPVAGVILGAGMSIRLGRPKQLLIVEKKPILARVIEAALQSDLDRTVLVLGHGAGGIQDALSRVLDHPRLDVVINPNYAHGMSTSLIAGLARVRPWCGGIMVILGDHPFMDKATINQVLHRFTHTSRDICLPVHGQTQGHPVCFGSRHFDAIMALKGDVGARDIVRKNPDDIAEVDLSTDRSFKDVDTEQDYDHLTRRPPV